MKPLIRINTLTDQHKNVSSVKAQNDSLLIVIKKIKLSGGKASSQSERKKVVKVRTIPAPALVAKLLGRKGVILKVIQPESSAIIFPKSSAIPSRTVKPNSSDGTITKKDEYDPQ